MPRSMRLKQLTLGFCAALTITLITGCAQPAKRTTLAAAQSYPAIGPYSQMVAHGSLIYLSGVLPLTPAGNAVQGNTVEEQTQTVLDLIGLQLASQGLSHQDILFSTVYLKDLNEFAAMNKVYGSYFKNSPPARATVEVARLPRDVKIQIAVVAGRR